MTPEALQAAALAVQQHAYAKYSQFRVGAALATPGGAIFTGCNVENSSYGLTICAERVALFAAVAAGEQEFTGLAIASPGGVMPCGACLQVLAEFVNELNIWLVDSEQKVSVRETSLGRLLPERFKFNGPARK